MSTTQANDEGKDVNMDEPINERYELYAYVLPDGDKTPEWEKAAEEAVTAEISKDHQIYKDQVTLLLQWMKKKDQNGDESQMKEEALLLAKRSVIYGTDIKKHSDHNDPLQSLKDEIEKLDTEQESYEFGDRPIDISDQAWSDKRRKMMKEQDDEDAETEKKREDHIKQGMKRADPLESFNGIDSVVHAVREDIPANVLPLHKTMCVLILQWWENGLTKDDSIKFSAINSNIDTIENGQSYKVAPTEIELWLNNLRTCTTECEENPKEDGLLRLVGTAITLTNRLRKAGLDWKMVIGRDTHRRVLYCLRESSSKEVQNQLALFAASYLYPRKKQLECLEGCMDMLLSFLVTETGEVRDETLPICIEQIKRINAKLGERNIQLGLRKSDHNIPTRDLEAAVRCVRAGRRKEVTDHLAKLHYKLKLLKIPGLEKLEQVCKGINVDPRAAEDEVMDLPIGLDPSQMVEDVPILMRSPYNYAYDGVPMKTVGWGDHLGRFYINQYGPRNSPIWRKECRPSSEWVKDYGNGDPPIEYKITSPANRFGDKTHDVTGKKSYCQQHIGGIYGVAFAATDDSLEILHPNYYNPKRYDKPEDIPTWPSDYVLIGWDLDSTEKDMEKRWEPRSVLRRCWGKKKADEWMFTCAKRSQDAFDNWRRGGRESRDESPELLEQYASHRQASADRVMQSTEDVNNSRLGSVTPGVNGRVRNMVLGRPRPRG